ADDAEKPPVAVAVVDCLAVWITAHTNNASSTSPPIPAATITDCWSCQLGSSSSPLTAGMLGPAAQDLLGTPGKCALQERAEADPANPERPERRGIILVGEHDRVDRQWQLGSQAPQRIRVVTAHRIPRIGPRRSGFFDPR